MIEIREEKPEDLIAIRELNKKAFGQDQEANIIDALRTNGGVLLSLVAMICEDGLGGRDESRPYGVHLVKDRVVGHILYSPASVGGEITGAALGPMAVLPEHQRQGIGSKLIEAGNRKLKEIGCPFIIVVGHSNYYPRFGFKHASASGIKCEWDVPDDAFMLLILDETKMKHVSGLARYRPEFSTVL